MWKIILLCFTLLSGESVRANNDSIKDDINRFPGLIITYRYEKFSRFPSVAQAVVRKEGERVVGEAEVDKIRWRRYAEATELDLFIVEETHFSADGRRIYQGRSKFNADGRKVEEVVVEGKKQLDLFPAWPVNPLP